MSPSPLETSQSVRRTQYIVFSWEGIIESGGATSLILTGQSSFPAASSLLIAFSLSSKVFSGFIMFYAILTSVVTPPKDINKNVLL